jgi:hypothetical protein
MEVDDLTVEGLTKLIWKILRIQAIVIDSAFPESDCRDRGLGCTPT